MRAARLLLIVIVLLLTLFPVPLEAADLRSGATVTVGPTEIVNDDLYVSGNEINIQGTVNGDVVAFAGTITITGTVAGDVIAAGGNVDVGGTVRGSVRTAGGTVTIRGPVAKDVLAAGGTVAITPAGSIGRDLLVGGNSVAVDGLVGRDVRVTATDLTLGGRVGGNVEASVQTLHLTDRAAIAGNLIYTSPGQATIAPGATVRGRIERRAPPAPRPTSPIDQIGEIILGWVRTLVGLFALGLLLVLLFPRFTSRTLATVRVSPWASLGIGFALLVGVPVLALLVFLLGLLVGGWWLALILLAIEAIALVVAYVVSSVFVGCWILERIGRTDRGLVVALLTGLITLLLLGLIPVVGALVGLVATVLGLGALVLTAAQAHAGPVAPPAA